jgi:acyl-CoA thioesterase
MMPLSHPFSAERVRVFGGTLIAQCIQARMSPVIRE